MFIVDLWESVFTPGTTPALMAATHGSFILLILLLISLIVVTRLIHFIVLLVIALCLYATVIWFVAELEVAKLQLNAELLIDHEAVSKATASPQLKVASLSPSVTGSSSNSTLAKKRKA